MGKYTFNRDVTKTDELGYGHHQQALFNQGIINIRTTTAWKVTQRGAGANMSVDVAAGDGMITYTSYNITAFSDATENVVITTSNPTNPRIDTIVAYIDRSVASTASNNNPNGLAFAAVAGTPAGSPTAPNGATIQAAVGSSNPYIVLANVAVAAAASNIVNANITDTRVTLSFAGKLYGGSSNTAGHTIPNIADDTVALLNASQTMTGKTLTNPIISGGTFNGVSSFSGTFDGWITGLTVPNTVTYNGAGIYSLVFNSINLTTSIFNGMRLKSTRTVTAPTQCTSLNGSTQYYSKTTPTGVTFTNNWCFSAWVKINAYQSQVIISRYNGTSGFSTSTTATGAIAMEGFNAGAANSFTIISSRSIPVNKWVHVAGQMDMTNTTNDATNNYIMIDGANVAATAARAGTNPTALIQAGNLEIGGRNAGLLPFNGKLAQVAIYSAKVTQATIAASISQTLAGTETSLISAYSFNNSINDLNANANNLTAQGSAVATNVDSPFAGGSSASTAYTAGTTEFAEVFNVSFSTNTTVVAQVPDGYLLPTSGGISAMAYSTSDSPVGWPGRLGLLGYALMMTTFSSGATAATLIPALSLTVYIPLGRKIRITATPGQRLTDSAAAAQPFLQLFDTSTAGTQLAETGTTITATSNSGYASPSIIISGVSGSKTYIAALRSNTTTSQVAASITAPASLTVELV